MEQNGRQDARNLAKALWVHVVTGEFGIPTVHKPAATVREQRSLFAQYCLLNRQIATHKNRAHAIFAENGMELKRELEKPLFASESGLGVLTEMSIRMPAACAWSSEILLAGEPLKSEVELLISIKRVTPSIALAP